MFDLPADATQVLQEHFTPQQVQAVTQALVPAIMLQPAAHAAAQPGATRLGGTPDLPADAQWPRPAPADDPEAIARRGNDAAAAEMRAHLKANLPYAFMGQIDLDEAHALGDVARPLPEHGRLLFFYDLAVGPWETGMRPARVLWDQTPRDALKPLAMPPDLAQAMRQQQRELRDMIVRYRDKPSEALSTNYGAPAHFMTLKYALRLAHPEALEAEPLMKSQSAKDGADFSGPYRDALDQLGEYYPEPAWKRHQLLGSPLPEQSDPRYDAVVVTRFGKQHLSRDEWRSHAERIQTLARQWRLLWQVDLSDWGGELSEGTVYFLIRDTDLAQRRFDQVVAVYQQT
ncbi:Domain of uncharacterised function (DUF1963) [Bordetella ansorpii]|uniref:Domain of uncharacterized function (DUF1963) n=1 Tax=Bordetella ansorpii TaxID=288768 RepID=A0A157SP32_9BORD|nr:DUF1963 domain-containing protein [Bordetella ansorpii]SAI71636.1 Domain of uncharacterised function (DUF1963) [Bordetella ansorpii]